MLYGLNVDVQYTSIYAYVRPHTSTYVVIHIVIDFSFNSMGSVSFNVRVRDRRRFSFRGRVRFSVRGRGSVRFSVCVRIRVNSRFRDQSELTV